jgi:UDP-N-acetylglucosamine 2-epimerase (non-hydrolysing)
MTKFIKNKKILVVFGTRPEAIKMAPIISKLLEDTVNFDTKICITSQHRQMLDQVLPLFEITPDYDLDIMKPNQDLFSLTQRILVRIKHVLQDFKPCKVIVHGDTTTSLVASLAAFYQKISVMHVEAGLRTGNLYSPWPEEGNRKLTAVLADYHFAPTQISKNNLLLEGVNEAKIAVTGNTVIDALQLIMKKINADYNLKNSLIKSIKVSGFSELNSKFILVTGHRRENFGEGFLNICRALKNIAKTNPNINILYPVHLNPKVRKPVIKHLSGITNIKLVSPFQYQEFILIMSKSYIILTDSGGVQEEAPAFGKPVLVMRNETERPEGVKAGTVKLVGSSFQKIVDEVQVLLDNKNEYKKMSEAHNPYGDGFASKKIVNKLRVL